MVWLISCPKKPSSILCSSNCFFCLQQQRAGAAGGVVDFVHAFLSEEGEAGNQLRDVLRCEEFAAGFARVGGVVGNQVFVGIAEEINVMVFKTAKIQLRYAFENGSKAFVFVGDGAAKAVAGGVEIIKETFDCRFGRVAGSGFFNGAEDGFQLGIELVVLVGMSSDVAKELAGVDEVAFGFDGVIHNFRGDNVVGHGSIADTGIATLNVVGEMFADEAVKEGAEDVLFEIPAVHGAAHVVGDFPDLAVQLSALLGRCHGGSYAVGSEWAL